MAKITSASATASSAASSGVATRWPSSRAKIRAPLVLLARPAARAAACASRGRPRSPRRCRWSGSSRMPVKTSSAPITYSTGWNSSSSVTPATMNTVRSISATAMPNVSTSALSACGTANVPSSTAITKTLSSDSAFSIRKPAQIGAGLGCCRSAPAPRGRTPLRPPSTIRSSPRRAGGRPRPLRGARRTGRTRGERRWPRSERPSQPMMRKRRSRRAYPQRNFSTGRELRASVRKLMLALGATAALTGGTTFVLAQAQCPAGTRRSRSIPFPGTLTAGEKTTISFRGGDADALGTVTVRGSRSGNHPGKLLAHPDGQGASFVPDKPFEANERSRSRTDRNVVGADQRRLRVQHRRRDHAQGAPGRVPERRPRHRPEVRDAPRPRAAVGDGHHGQARPRARPGVPRARRPVAARTAR